MSVRKRRSGVAAVAVALAVLIWTAPAIAATQFVTIVDFEYQPAEVTVTAGELVIWTNGSGQDHTVTADGGSFASERIAAGESSANTFETAGSFAYHCEIHPDMKGTVVVDAAPATTAPSGSLRPTPPAGTLPPNFSPFPQTAAPAGSEAPTTPGPAASPTTAPTPVPGDTTGDSGDRTALLLLVVLAVVFGTLLVLWVRRRRMA